MGNSPGLHSIDILERISSLGIVSIDLSFRYPHKNPVQVGLENLTDKFGPYDKSWAQVSNGGGIRMKDWCNVTLLHCADKSQYPVGIFFSLVQCISLFCVHSYRTFISYLERVWPDNAITTQRAPNGHFRHTTLAILMSMRLRLSQNRTFCLFTWSPRSKCALSLTK